MDSEKEIDPRIVVPQGLKDGPEEGGVFGDQVAVLLPEVAESGQRVVEIGGSGVGEAGDAVVGHGEVFLPPEDAVELTPVPQIFVFSFHFQYYYVVKTKLMF